MGIEIRLAKARGFCAGVERALNKVEEALRNGPFPVYVLHECTTKRWWKVCGNGA